MKFEKLDAFGGVKARGVCSVDQALGDRQASRRIISRQADQRSSFVSRSSRDPSNFRSQGQLLGGTPCVRPEQV